MISGGSAVPFLARGREIVIGPVRNRIRSAVGPKCLLPELPGEKVSRAFSHPPARGGGGLPLVPAAPLAAGRRREVGQRDRGGGEVALRRPLELGHVGARRRGRGHRGGQGGHRQDWAIHLFPPRLGYAFATGAAARTSR